MWQFPMHDNHWLNFELQAVSTEIKRRGVVIMFAVQLSVNDQRSALCAATAADDTKPAVSNFFDLITSIVNFF